MSVEFEPVKLGQPRRFDPVPVAAIIVAFALGAAVLKPWGDVPTAAPVPAVVAAPVASASGPEPSASAGVPIPRILRAASSSPSWTEIKPVIRRHESWGIRAIVRNSTGATGSPTPRYTERWFRFPAGGTGLATAQVDSGDEAIVALGVTFPPAHTPLDVRIWRLADGGAEWVDTEAIDSVPSGGAFLHVRPGPAGGPSLTWAAGRYRVDVLVDGAIRRLGVNIPDRFANVPERRPRPTLHDARPLIDPAEVALTDVPVGLFATVDGNALPLAADDGEPLDEAGSWLNVDPGTGRAPRSFVATAYLPRATGIGVMLPPRSVVMSATISRLAPDPFPEEPSRVDPGARLGATSSYVLFRVPGEGAWSAGVYRLSVVWADFDGLHDESWHVELRPGPLRSVSRLLMAARMWARYAGTSGVILGTAEPLEGGPRWTTIRLVRLRPEGRSPYPAESGVGCGESIIDGHPGILGFAYPADRNETRATARILLPFLRRADQVTMTAAFGVPGLILLAPARRPILAPGTYRFTVGEGKGAIDYALCIDMAAFDD